MATFALTSVGLYVDGYDVSGDTNQLSLESTAQELDVTTFGSGGSVARIAGLTDTAFSHQGFVDLTDNGIDEQAFANVTGIKPVTICPTGGADGETAFIFQSLQTQYNPGASVGEVYAFTVSGAGTAPLAGGKVLATKSAKTATSTGTAVQLEAVSATQKLFANLHVFAASGTTPTLVVKVQSDDNSGFTSAVDRITFSTATGITAEAKSVAGAVTDTYWRVSYTITGTSPSFTFAVAAGIK